MNYKEKIISPNNGFLVGLLFGGLYSFVFFLVLAESSGLFDFNSKIIFDYQGLIGGVCTLFAAFIAYYAGQKHFQHFLEEKRNEEERFIKILKEEASVIELRISDLIDKFDNSHESDAIPRYGLYFIGSDHYKRKHFDNFYNDFVFEIPNSFYDYSVLSKLNPEKIEKVVALRSSLERIISEYFKSHSVSGNEKFDAAPNWGSLLSQFKEAKKLFNSAFGVIIRVKPIDINVDINST